MILGEVFPGEDAEVLVEAIKADWSGEDEDTIQDLVVYVKQYKQTEEVATGATAVWNSNMGQYLITIPAAYVPASGIFDVCVRGSDIDDVLIRLQVNTGDAQLTAIKAITDLLTLAAINAEVDTAISDAALPNAFLTAAIRSGGTVSQVLRIIEIMLDGSVTGLTSGSGSPVTFTGADGSTVAFTVDANGNRAISSVNLV